ncbi:pirin family protein [Dyadobacter frigoris]|uniref:Pirin n=1 Tax=Dyadobacter frigoris TaxID=2576211 RepID=A0A4U6D9P9_9BACT|nr:pirin family protein [Dyadobacter frigoris]TKT94230.1 pirin [Dyadobacter frigoris]GLU50579.1 quercetin 2,3-dioxygenase [Dyadobacter frigoris]
MITQTEGQIYLAGQRGCSQLSWFRSFHTFNFGLYQDQNREPFGNLQVFNDDTLAAGKSFKMQLEENTEVILLPVVGAIEYKNSLGETGILEAGQMQIFSAAKGMEYEIINPYETELINFIQLFLTNNQHSFIPKMQEINIDLEIRNQLFPLFSQGQNGLTTHQGTFGYIGKYSGRQEDLYQLKNPENGIFVFIIEGAFEVQNRLMEARDGLSLWNLDELEFEALSNDAIILILEVSWV